MDDPQLTNSQKLTDNWLLCNPFLNRLDLDMVRIEDLIDIMVGDLTVLPTYPEPVQNKLLFKRKYVIWVMKRPCSMHF